MWVTTHPFGYSQEWVTMETPEAVRKAVEEFPELLNGRIVDEDMLRTVASRVWLLIFNEKQERLFLTPDEVLRVHALLKRKESSL